MAQGNLGTALVTGASAGIGAVYADRLARRGYDLVLVARDIARLEALAAKLTAQHGGKVEVLTADLADRAAVEKVAERAQAEDMTLLVNNAGIALSGGTLDNEVAALERLIAVNVTAPTILARLAGAAFRARGAGGIINIASVVALTPEMLNGAYGASKSYVLSFSNTLRQELAEHGVTVQAVLPGATRTELWSRSDIDIDGFPPEIVMSTDDLVDAALVGFDRGEAVTIPPLADEALYTSYEDARLALRPHLSKRDVAARYLSLAEAA